MNSQNEIILEEVNSIPYEVFDNTNIKKLSFWLMEFDMIKSEDLKAGYLIKLGLLEELDLCGVRISDHIFLNEICKLKNLKKLSLMYSSIRQIPPEIENLTYLNELCLRDNYIKEIPKSFSNLKNIKILNVMNNGFEEIPSMLKDLPALKQAWFRENPLTLKSQKLLNSIGMVNLDKLY
ncbi:MAG: hypothetical protein WCH34_08560 [Bacteroidota bacterium]